MNKDIFKAALKRAMHTFWQTLAACVPVGVVVTPKMIEEFNWSALLVVAAWILTALFAAIFSFVKSMAAGMPEVQLADTLYALENDGEDEPNHYEEDE